MIKKVGIVGCKSYNQKNIDFAVMEVLSKVGFKAKEGMRVLIKPNLVGQNTPNQHSITHYSIIDTLCKYFSEAGCEVTVGESSAFYQKGYTMKAFETSRIKEVAHKYYIPVIAFENEKLKRIEKKKLKFLDELFLPATLDNFDLIVNVPKLKSHMLMRYSGAVKNLYGLVPGGYKQLLHTKTKNINEMAEIFLDILENIKAPILTVMDGVIGLDGGPAAVIGKPKKVGYILASMDPSALDVIGCQMIGYTPMDVPTITMALKRGILKSLKEVKQIGSFKPVLFKKLQKGPIVDKSSKSTLVTETRAYPCATKKCIHCGACIKYCPLGALSEVNGKVTVDKSKCISCYTCVPVCPMNAIKLCDSFIGKVIRFVRKVIRS